MVRNGVKAFIKDESIISHRFFTMRPEQLSVADFVELTGMIEKQI